MMMFESLSRFADAVATRFCFFVCADAIHKGTACEYVREVMNVRFVSNSAQAELAGCRIEVMSRNEKKCRRTLNFRRLKL